MSADWVPSGFDKATGAYEDTEAVSQRLVDQTNATFASLGVKVQRDKIQRQTGTTVMCAGCGKAIVGRVLGAMDATWHPGCFECSLCAQTIDMQAGTFAVQNNKPVCKKCCMWQKREQPQQQQQQQQQQQHHHQQPQQAQQGMTAADAARRDQGKKRCMQCQAVIMTDGINAGNNVWFHTDCFKCGACGEQIDSMSPFVSHYGQYLHKDCHLRQESRSKCSACHQPITGKFVKTPDQKKFHKQCFVCHSCRKPLSGAFLEKHNHVLCVTCANSPAVLSKLSSAAVPPMPQSKQHLVDEKGIRYDHMRFQTKETSAYVASRAAANAATQATVLGQPIPEQPTASASAAAPKFCTECGAKRTGTGKFCTECGHKH